MKAFSEYRDHFTCQGYDEDHCLTCSDEAVVVQVVSIKPDSIARVEGNYQIEEAGAHWDAQCGSGAWPTREEVDITLIEGEEIAPGDFLLVHAGVALARLKKGEVNDN